MFTKTVMPWLSVPTETYIAPLCGSPVPTSSVNNNTPNNTTHKSNEAITWNYEELFQMLSTKEKNEIRASVLEHSTALADKVFQDSIRDMSETYRNENKALVKIREPLDKMLYFRGA